jgi:hypothetical protein
MRFALHVHARLLPPPAKPPLPRPPPPPPPDQHSRHNVWLAGLSETSSWHDSHRCPRPSLSSTAILRTDVFIPSVISVLVTSMFWRRRAPAPCILSNYVVMPITRSADGCDEATPPPADPHVTAHFGLVGAPFERAPPAPSPGRSLPVSEPRSIFSSSVRASVNIARYVATSHLNMLTT